jgi:hypothetical protein
VVGGASSTHPLDTCEGARAVDGHVRAAVVVGEARVLLLARRLCSRSAGGRRYSLKGHVQGGKGHVYLRLEGSKQVGKEVSVRPLHSVLLGL